MILKMEKLSAFGLLSDKDALLKELMRERSVQIRSPEALEEFEALGELTESLSGDVYALEQSLGRYQSALALMAPYSAKTGMFTMKPRVVFDKLEDAGMLEKGEALLEKVETIGAEMADLRASKAGEQFQKAALEPWAAGDLPLEVDGTETTVVARYLLPGKIDEDAMEARRRELAPASVLEKVAGDREQQYYIAACHRSDEDAMWEVLKEFGANRVSFPGLVGTAAENVAVCHKRITEIDGALARCEEKLKELGADTFPLKYAFDVLSVKIQRGRADNELLGTRETFCFTAWVPEELKGTVTKILDKYGCYYEFSEVGEEEEAPILLKNNKIVSNYEAVTSMYSLPAYHSMDPDKIVSFFYFLFFGMMLSDAGIGLILLIGGIVLGKKADLGPNAKKLTNVIAMGGLSAVIWGFLYGSWFGDMFEVIPKVFWGAEDVVVWRAIDPLTQAVLVMGIAMALGFVHILIGMGCKAYLLIKRGKTLDAVFDVGFWYLVLIGLVLMLAGGMLLGADSTLFLVGVFMAIAGAIGLILTQGRDKKNPIMRIMSGIMSLYDVTGYFSDVLSYSRILALGLATGVIAQVVNIMGTLPGRSILGVIVYILVFTVGTALNLGINTLGAYVHTARLQYVEFFGKFYEAGGRPFAPLMAQTKYVVVTNKEEN